MTTTIMNTNPLPEPDAEFGMVLRLTEELGESESRIMRLEQELERTRQKMIEQVQINYIYRNLGNWICNDASVDMYDFTDDFVEYLEAKIDEFSPDDCERAISMYEDNQLKDISGACWEKDDESVVGLLREHYEEMIEDNDIDLDECDPHTDEHLPHNFLYYWRVCEMGEKWYSYRDELHEVIHWAVELPYDKGYFIEYC